MLAPAEQKQVQTLVKDPTVTGEVQQDYDSAIARRVNQTPTLLIKRGNNQYAFPGPGPDNLLLAPVSDRWITQIRDYCAAVAFRVILGVIFIYAGWVKLKEPWELFALAISSYQLLPLKAVEIVARSLPWLEWRSGSCWWRAGAAHFRRAPRRCCCWSSVG